MTKNEALKLALEALEWSYGGEPMPTKELEAMGAIRQVLAEWTPDDTAYRPDGLSQEELIKMSSDYLTNGMAFMKAGKHVPVDEVIDRGAWDGVEDATKWVDELRGNEPSTDVEPIAEIVEAHGLIAVAIPEMPPVGTKLYSEPPKRLWAGLTTEQRNNIMQEHGNDWKRYTEEVERQLQENNS